MIAAPPAKKTFRESALDGHCQYWLFDYDLRFGDIFIAFLDDKKSNRVMVKQQTCPDVAVYEMAERQAKRRMTVNHPTILQIIDYSTHIDSVHVYFEYLPYKLSDDIHMRIDKAKPFSLYELTTLAEDVLSALGYLHHNSLVHGDLRPLYITKALGRFKVADRLNYPSRPCDVQIRHCQASAPLYLSPLLLDLIHNKLEPPVQVYFYADLYALGLIILEAGLLQTLQAIYDLERGIVKIEEVKNFIEIFDQAYGKTSRVSSLVKELLGFGQIINPSAIELQRFLAVMEAASLDTNPSSATEFSKNLNNESASKIGINSVRESNFASNSSKECDMQIVVEAQKVEEAVYEQNVRRSSNMALQKALDHDIFGQNLSVIVEDASFSQPSLTEKRLGPMHETKENYYFEKNLTQPDHNYLSESKVPLSGNFKNFPFASDSIMMIESSVKNLGEWVSRLNDEMQYNSQKITLREFTSLENNTLIIPAEEIIASPSIYEHEFTPNFLCNAGNLLVKEDETLPAEKNLFGIKNIFSKLAEEWIQSTIAEYFLSQSNKGSTNCGSNNGLTEPNEALAPRPILQTRDQKNIQHLVQPYLLNTTNKEEENFHNHEDDIGQYKLKNLSNPFSASTPIISVSESVHEALPYNNTSFYASPPSREHLDSLFKDKIFDKGISTYQKAGILSLSNREMKKANCLENNSIVRNTDLSLQKMPEQIKISSPNKKKDAEETYTMEGNVSDNLDTSNGKKLKNKTLNFVSSGKARINSEENISLQEITILNTLDIKDRSHNRIASCRSSESSLQTYNLEKMPLDALEDSSSTYLNNSVVAKKNDENVKDELEISQNNFKNYITPVEDPNSFVKNVAVQANLYSHELNTDTPISYTDSQRTFEEKRWLGDHFNIINEASSSKQKAFSPSLFSFNNCVPTLQPDMDDANSNTREIFVLKEEFGQSNFDESCDSILVPISKDILQKFAKKGNINKSSLNILALNAHTEEISSIMQPRESKNQNSNKKIIGLVAHNESGINLENGPHTVYEVDRKISVAVPLENSGSRSSANKMDIRGNTSLKVPLKMVEARFTHSPAVIPTPPSQWVNAPPLDVPRASPPFFPTELKTNYISSEKESNQKLSVSKENNDTLYTLIETEDTLNYPYSDIRHNTVQHKISHIKDSVIAPKVLWPKSCDPRDTVFPKNSAPQSPQITKRVVNQEARNGFEILVKDSRYAKNSLSKENNTFIQSEIRENKALYNNRVEVEKIHFLKNPTTLNSSPLAAGMPPLGEKREVYVHSSRPISQCPQHLTINNDIKKELFIPATSPTYPLSSYRDFPHPETSVVDIPTFTYTLESSPYQKNRRALHLYNNTIQSPSNKRIPAVTSSPRMVIQKKNLESRYKNAELRLCEDNFQVFRVSRPSLSGISDVEPPVIQSLTVLNFSSAVQLATQKIT